jgi:hypothetical protein
MCRDAGRIDYHTRMVTDTLTIDHLERDGQALRVDPPLVFAVHPSTITAGRSTYHMWCAELVDEVSVVPNTRGAGAPPAPAPLGPSTRRFAPLLALREVTLQRDELPAALARQVWWWYDTLLAGGDGDGGGSGGGALETAQIPVARQLRQRLRPARP